MSGAFAAKLSGDQPGRLKAAWAAAAAGVAAAVVTYKVLRA